LAQPAPTPSLSRSQSARSAQPRARSASPSPRHALALAPSSRPNGPTLQWHPGPRVGAPSPEWARSPHHLAHFPSPHPKPGGPSSLPRGPAYQPGPLCPSPSRCQPILRMAQLTSSLRAGPARVACRLSPGLAPTPAQRRLSANVAAQRLSAVRSLSPSDKAVPPGSKPFARSLALRLARPRFPLADSLGPPVSPSSSSSRFPRRALPTLLRPARAVKLHCPVDPSPCRTHWQPPVRAPLPETSSPEPGIARDCCAIRFNPAQAPPRSPAITFLRQSAVILGPTFKLRSEASTPAPCPPAQP
jgi:hypothetical protein